MDSQPRARRVAAMQPRTIKAAAGSSGESCSHRTDTRRIVSLAAGDDVVTFWPNGPDAILGTSRGRNHVHSAEDQNHRGEPGGVPGVPPRFSEA